ncbi:MAG: SelA-like pyridoxal phosphate-dependent enzyme [Gammaproteobacteria bacterium]|nr:SelA-like pyridoxal phosphate-dependent enzyme [Gammaproteobacteria bacterium]
MQPGLEDIQTQVAAVNAAGKMTALGGSAQHADIASVMAEAAQMHVDLSLLRQLGGEMLAEMTGAEAACITTGAAAGICIAVAAILTGQDLHKVQQLPQFPGENRFLLQAGHAVNFGASVEQMIRMGGGTPLKIGAVNAVSKKLLSDTIADTDCAGFVYVQSHHCVQENMLDLSSCIEICHAQGKPVLVDAAAEEDLRLYIESGADLVTYSGGKAIGGPTAGFIAGKKALIAACELQFLGIARPMKVGKEQIMGLLKALTLYTVENREARKIACSRINRQILAGIEGLPVFKAVLRQDEAGRDINRIAISPVNEAFAIKDLIQFLSNSTPSIRTRNHHMDQGFIQIDSRELDSQKADYIIERLSSFAGQLEN